jgi:hypothetical protein
VNYQANTGAARTATITVVRGTVTRTVAVNQAAGSNIACNDSTYEPNNSLGQPNQSAFSMIHGSAPVPTTRFAIIGSTTDKDFFRLRAAGRGTFSINLSSLPANYNLSLYSLSTGRKNLFA